MKQTAALLIDAYRELNAKKLFWVVLVLSGLVVVAFACVGLSPRYVTILGRETPLQFGTSFVPRATFYKLLFLLLGIRVWLAWAAMGLALVSTAGIFPDLLGGGAIDLYLSKPIGRLKLFCVKYLAGLLFVAFQVTVFCLGCFLVFGLRAGLWLGGVFWAVPIVVLIFSYLYAVCVLVGVLTRSTVAALLLAILFWFLLWAGHATEVGLLRAQVGDEQQAARLDAQIAQDRATTSAPPATSPTTRASSRAAAVAPTRGPRAATRPGTGGWAGGLSSFFGGAAALDGPLTPTREQARLQLPALERQRAEMTFKFDLPHRIAYGVMTALPKTSETGDLLERVLARRAELMRPPDEADDAASANAGFRSRQRGRAANRAVDEQLLARPLWWVVGTSLAFEAAIVGAAAWVFCRRDY